MKIGIQKVFCQNLDKIIKVDNIYCPNVSSKKTDDNLTKDNSIKFSIYPDSKGFYGKNMVLCDFQFISNDRKRYNSLHIIF